MACPRGNTPGDVRNVRQGTSLLDIAGEKTMASAPWVIKNVLPVRGRIFFYPDGFFCPAGTFETLFLLLKSYGILEPVTE